MAEGERPVIQPGAASAKRQVSARQLLIWVAGAAVLAAAAFAVVRFVGFGGTESQSASSSATLPPDPEPVPTTTVTTTTTEATVATSDTVPPVVETSDAVQTLTPPEPDAASPTTTAPPVEAPEPPPADGHFVRISDGGDFTGEVTLFCADYDATIGWHVDPPYREADDGGRSRTFAPLGNSGRLRILVETFVPIEDHPDAPEDGDPDAVDPEAPEDEPTEPPTEEIVPQVPETVLVLDVSSISGRGTDRDGEGDASAVLRHRCPAESFDEHAEWKLMVEAHAEVAWELTFETGDAKADDDTAAETSDAIGGVNGNEEIDELIEGILRGEGVVGP